MCARNCVECRIVSQTVQIASSLNEILGDLSTIKLFEMGGLARALASASLFMA